MKGLFLLLALNTPVDTGAEAECAGQISVEPESALFGAGFSNPPAKLELPSGWELVSVGNRVLPLPLEHVDRVGLIPYRERVDLIVLGNEESGRLWTIDLSAFSPRRFYPDTPLEMISAAIEGNWNRSLTPEECEELEILNIFLGAFSTRHSNYAFRLGQNIILDAGKREENLWNVMWRDSAGNYLIASWNLDFGKEGILRAINEEAQIQSDPHPIEQLLECALNKQPFNVCREIALPGIEMIDWRQSIRQHR